MIENSSGPYWIATSIAAKPFKLGALCLAIPVLGIMFTLLGCTAFQRSGAVLVCLAIYAVYLNHLVSVRLSSDESDYSKGEFLGDLGDIHEIVNRMIEPRKPRSETDKIAEEIIKAHEDAKQSIPKLQSAGTNIIRIELFAGVGGTLIWAFGDLFFCYCK